VAESALAGVESRLGFPRHDLAVLARSSMPAMRAQDADAG
jgi:hypothetical protein